MFNLAQLASYEQARELAGRLSSGPIVVGGGVKPGTDEGHLSNIAPPGIYRPQWTEGPWSQEPFYEADGVKMYFLHFRFNNGAEGMNVGLILDKFKRYPNSPLYVMSEIAAEANMIASMKGVS
jgi:hypothetical protein